MARPNKLAVSVIVLNWNRKQEVVKLIGESKQQTFADLEIIVVDNHSSDGSVDFIKKRYPGVALVDLERNYGKAGFNFGMEEARGKYLVLFDSDVRPEKNVVEKYVAKLKANPKLGLACPEVYLPSGEFFGPPYVKEKRNKDGGYDVLFFAGGSVALPKTVFEKVGGFEERYFMCLEELEWAVRVRSAGFKVAVFPEIQVVDQKSISGAGYRGRLGFYYSRNWVWFYLKYLPFRKTLKFFVLHLRSFFQKTGKGGSMRRRDCFQGVVASLPLTLKFLQERQPLSDAILRQVKIDLFSHSNDL